MISFYSDALIMFQTQLTRLLPDAVGTTCGDRLEKVYGCEHSDILRVPFRDEKGAIVRRWISRFEVWPYLQTYAEVNFFVITIGFHMFQFLLVFGSQTC